MQIHTFKYIFAIMLFTFFSCNQVADPLDENEDISYMGKYRPQIHFSSKYNWINDPNGLIYFDGEYHLFFQHNPFGANWGFMSWGHAVSADLIHWTQLNVALKPDNLGDIFSGSVVIDKNNSAGFGENAMVAIYTSASDQQRQSIAFSTDKGRTFIKYRDNPVLSNPYKADFRDPKVFWHTESSQWIMSLATKQTITFYSSPNLKQWTKLSEFGENIGAQGGVWECPDLIPLTYEVKTKWVLLVSINPGGPNGGSATQYFIGDFDGKTFTADKRPYPLWLDYGRDNYAGVTWDNIPQNDGRRILIAWMNNWDYAGNTPQYSSGNNGARSSMTLPRELSLIKNANGNLTLKNKIVKEIENISNNWTSIANETIREKKIFSMDLNNKKAYQIQLESSVIKDQIITLTMMNENNEMCQIEIDNRNHRVSFSRKNSGYVSFSDRFVGSSVAPFYQNEPTITLDIYVDQSSIEFFVNDGALSFTNQIFPQSIYNKFSIEQNEASVTINAKYRTFERIWK